MTHPTTAKRPPWIFIAVLAVVVLAGIAAVAATRGGGDDGPTATDDTGTVVASVTGTGFDGDDIAIDTTDGTAKVIIGIAHWCPHCQAEVPRLVAHLAETPMPDDVELVAVSTAVDEARGNFPPQAWLEREGWTVPTIDDLDGSVAQALGVGGFPYFLVLDAEGKVVVRTSGEITMDQFDQLVAAAQTGTAPA